MLDEILKNKTILNYCDSTKSIDLKENGAESKIKKISITGFDSRPLAIKLDIDTHICTVKHFKNVKDINKLCDFVIIYKENILFIDLKSRKISKSKLIKQFQMSELLIEYFFKAYNIVNDIEEELESKVKCICISNHLNKSTISVRKNYLKKMHNNKEYFEIPTRNNGILNINSMI